MKTIIFTITALLLFATCAQKEQVTPPAPESTILPAWPGSCDTLSRKHECAAALQLLGDSVMMYPASGVFLGENADSVFFTSSGRSCFTKADIYYSGKPTAYFDLYILVMKPIASNPQLFSGSIFTCGGPIIKDGQHAQAFAIEGRHIGNSILIARGSYYGGYRLNPFLPSVVDTLLGK